jgi:hypothetical protein
VDGAAVEAKNPCGSCIARIVKNLNNIVKNSTQIIEIEKHCDI